MQVLTSLRRLPVNIVMLFNVSATDNVEYEIKSKEAIIGGGGILKLFLVFLLGFIARGELNIWKKLNNNIFNDGDITINDKPTQRQ